MHYWRCTAMALVALGSLLSVAEALRLRVLGVVLRIALPLAGFYTLHVFVQPSPPAFETARTFSHRWIQWGVAISQAGLVVGVMLLTLVILQYSIVRTELFKRSRVVRCIFRMYQTLVLAGGALPLIAVVAIEARLYTGFLMEMAKASFLFALILAGMQLLSALLERAFRDSRTGLAISVVCVCLATAIQLFILQ